MATDTMQSTVPIYMGEVRSVKLVGLFDREAARQSDGRFGYRLTREHSEVGYAWLGAHWSELWKRFNPPDDLLSFDQVKVNPFRLTGYRVFDETWYHATVVPTYSVAYIGRYGTREFTYHWTAWQSGGGR